MNRAPARNDFRHARFNIAHTGVALELINQLLIPAKDPQINVKECDLGLGEPLPDNLRTTRGTSTANGGAELILRAARANALYEADFTNRPAIRRPSQLPGLRCDPQHAFKIQRGNDIWMVKIITRGDVLKDLIAHCQDNTPNRKYTA